MTTPFRCSSILVGVGVLWLAACDGGSASNPPPDPCAAATAEVVSACCAGGPAHPAWPDGNALEEGVVTYTDCVSGEPVAVPCVVTDGMPPAGSETSTEIPGEEQAIADPTAACTSATDEASAKCPGFDAADFDCGVVDSQYQALPSCDEMQKLADAVAAMNCKPIGRSGFTPIPDGAPEKLHDDLQAPPENVTPTPAPPPDDYEDGTPVPPPAGLLGSDDPNRLLDTFRLELPGNFMRYQLAIGPLRAGFQQAGTLSGFTCYPDELRCLINPLALFDLSAMFPDLGDLKIDPVPIDVGGQRGWRLQNVRYEPDLDGWPNFKVTWSGSVDLTLEEPVEINLGTPSRLSFLPLHQPDDSNGTGTNSYSLDGMPAPERQRNHLDRALLLNKVPQATCWELAMTPSYLTFRQPIRCFCPASASDTGYCVADLYPRADMPAAIYDYASVGEHASIVRCTDPMYIEWGYYSDHLGAPEADLTNLVGDIPIDEFLNTGRHGDMPAASALEDLRAFGCAGKLSKPVPIGDQYKVSMDYDLRLGNKVTSAAGLELATRVGMGGLRVTINAGVVEVSFDLGVKFDEWAKKHKLGPLGWLLKWFLRLLAGIINLAIDVDLPPTGIPNSAWVKLEPLDVTLQAMLSQVAPLGPSPQQGFSVGMRRIVTSTPAVTQNDWGLDVTWQNAHCGAVTGSGNLVQKFQALIGCPSELLANAVGLAMAPLTTFLGKQLLEIFLDLTDQLNGEIVKTVVTEVDKQENGNIIATLLDQATATALFAPYYAGALGSENQAAMGQLPPGIATACAAAPNPDLACTLAHLFVGNGLASGSVRMDLLRVGAKTHFRSLGDFGGATSFCLPPVRYCVPGDNPPGAADFTAADRTASQGFAEVHMNPPDATDWRNQCALFIDVVPRVKGTLQTPLSGYEMGIWVSRRTELLTNDIFTCQNSAHCHPGAPFLGQRAELAFCSVLGDIWGRPTGSTAPFANELYLLTTTTEPSGLQALQYVWDAFRKAIGIEVPANAFTELTTFAASCKAKLAEAGFPDPPATMPAATLLADPVNVCRDTLITP